jgi:FLVCR family MFS transporter
MDKYGLRWTVLLTGSLLDLVATCVRCAGTNSSNFWAIHLGQFLNGLVGCVVLIAPAKISQVWFHPSERATATSVMTLCNFLGSSIGFVVIPWQVNTWGMNGMLRQWAVIAACTAVLTIVYFPDAPPTPPSASAARKPQSFTKGLKALFTSKEFLLIFFACGVPNGFWTGFSSVISVILQPLPWNFSDSVDPSTMATSSAWLGMWATLCGVVGGMSIAAVVDKTRAHKFTLYVLTIATMFVCLWFLLTVRQYIGGGAAAIYASIILGNVFSNPTLPLFVELACEACYPVSATVVDGVIQFGFNLFALVFQVIGMSSNIYNDHPTVIAYLMPMAAAGSIICLIFVKGEHKRLAVDNLDDQMESAVVLMKENELIVN